MPLRIAIVDDETSFAEIAHLILSRAGYEVLTFERASEVVDHLSDLGLNLILSDVEMPEMDGFEFLHAVRRHKKTKDLPFILMSARKTYPPDRVKGLDLGSDDYITKPFSSDELVSRVKAVLRRAGHDAPMALGVSTEAVAAEEAPAPATQPSAPPPPHHSPADAPHAAAVLDPLPIFGDLRRRLGEGRPVAAILADLSYFRGYNECYGFDNGDNVLRFMRQCLDAANHLVCGGKAAVSHLYADEFLALTEPERALPFAHAALAEFVKGVPGFYADQDRGRGFIEGKTRQGRTLAFPFLNMILAVASNQRRRITHPGQFIHILRELLGYAKTLGGSRYVEDRRRDPAPKAS